MELFLKRYFWTVWLAFIALAAWLVARTANVYVAAAIEPAPNVDVSSRNTKPAPPASLTSVDVASFGHLFGIDPPPPPPPTDAAAAAPAEDTRICWTCQPVKTNLRLQLLATMVANEKKWSMALISDLDKQETQYFMVGDTVKNAKIHDVIREPQRVVIVNEDTHRLEYIDAVPGSGAAVVSTVGVPNLETAPVPPPDSGGANVANGDEDPALAVKQLGDGKYSVPKERLEKTLSNLNDVATQARIVPSFKNGVANGFKLFSIRPGSIYSAIGVQNGDVITRINGYDINSPDKALEVYSRLKDARNIEIDIERRGQIKKMTYSID